MERRYLYMGAGVAAAIVAIIVFFLLRAGKSEQFEPFKTIPQDAAIIVKINNPELPGKLIGKQLKIWNEALQMPFIDSFNRDIAFFDSISKTIPEFSESFKRNPIVMSGHFSGVNKLQFLVIVKAPAQLKERYIHSKLQEEAKKKMLNLGERKYEGTKIFSLALNPEKSISIALRNNNLLFSFSPILIEDALRQSELTESLINNPQFSSILKTTGKNKDANIYIDLSLAGKYMSIHSNQQMQSNFKKNDYFGGWTELDINLKDNLLLFNGFTTKTTENISFIQSISGGKPVEIEVHKILPASISCFFTFGLSNPSENYASYLEYLKRIKKYDRYSANLKNLKSKYGIDFAQFFLDLADNELTLAYKEGSDKVAEGYLLLIKCKSGTSAEKALLSLTNQLENKFNDKLLFTYNPDNELRQNVYRIPVYPLFERLLGDFYNVFEDNYLFVVGNYIVVASSFSQASEFLKESMLQKTLINDELYHQFSENLSQKSYLLSYINLARSKGFFNPYLSTDFLKGWETNIAAFQKLQTLGIQLSEVSNQPYFTVFTNYQEDYRGKPRTVWESLLDTTISQKPKFVINHITNQNEIVVQDDNNAFYLINQSGRILWKIQLNERINSEIFQIDYFKNGKLQYLFSTGTQIHLVDRNGNYVERYPVKLRAKATAGLALFDYEKDKNYRIFIPCSDKQVYAYTKEGNIIKDWTFKGSDYTVEQAVNHFRIAEKDYIVFGDANYTYILDRRGAERVRLAEPIEKSARNNYYAFDAGNTENSFFVTTNTTGEILKISLSGQISKQHIGSFSENHYFDFKDINGDGKPDYLFVDNNTLSAYSSEGNVLFENKLQETIDLPPVYYQFSFSDRKIGLVSVKSQKIMLINKNGEMYKGFPLEGTTQFSIGYFDITSNRFNLIVGGRNNFLYNYTVE